MWEKSLSPYSEIVPYPELLAPVPAIATAIGVLVPNMLVDAIQSAGYFC